MVNLKEASNGGRRSNLKQTLPYAAQRIIDEEIMPMQNARTALAHLLVMERTALNIIDNGIVSKANSDFRAGSVEVVEVVRTAKRKIADRLRLTSSQREALDM
jgi:hypothetical protein